MEHINPKVLGQILCDLTQRGIKRLHPTQKKCGCGFVGTSAELHQHLEEGQTRAFLLGQTARDFWTQHGEVEL